jgi:hypothetical protein
MLAFCTQSGECFSSRLEIMQWHAGVGPLQGECRSPRQAGVGNGDRAFSGKRSHPNTAFGAGFYGFDLDRLRFLSVESRPGHMKVERLFQLGHERAQVLVTRIQDGP